MKRGCPGLIPRPSWGKKRNTILLMCRKDGTGKLRCQAVRCGFRGGTWNNGSTNERVSDRNNAANVDTTRNNNNGARFAKTTSFIGGRLVEGKFMELADEARIPTAYGSGKRHIEKGMSRSDSSP